MSVGLHVRYPLFLSDFNETQTFSTDFSKNIQIQNFMKILLVGAELFRADRRTYERTDRQTDMTNAIVAFFNFAQASKRWHRA